MRAGLMDPSGREETEEARNYGVCSLVLSMIGLLLLVALLVYFLVELNQYGWLVLSMIGLLLLVALLVYFLVELTRYGWYRQQRGERP